MMRCEVFTDPLYNGELFADFDPDDVVSIEERTVRLLLRPSQRVTAITMRNGDRWLLAGSQASTIEASRSGREGPR